MREKGRNKLTAGNKHRNVYQSTGLYTSSLVPYSSSQILLSNQRLKLIHRDTFHIVRTGLHLIIRSQDAQIDGAAYVEGLW